MLVFTRTKTRAGGRVSELFTVGAISNGGAPLLAVFEKRVSGSFGTYAFTPPTVPSPSGFPTHSFLPDWQFILKSPRLRS